MKLLATASLAICCIVAGCVYVPRNLPANLGWSVEKLSDARFRISTRQPAVGRDTEAVAVAADVALSRGFRFFTVESDAEHGTAFTWHTGYSGARTLMVFSVGSTFEIVCFTARPPEKDVLEAKKWIDAFDRDRKRPNQALEPTRGAVTPRAP